MINNPLNRPGGFMREIGKSFVDSENKKFCKALADWWKDYALDAIDKLAASEAAMQHFRREASEADVFRERMNEFGNELILRKEEIEVLKARFERMKQTVEMQTRRKREQTARLLAKLRYYHKRKMKRKREYQAQKAAGVLPRHRRAASPPDLPLAQSDGDLKEEGGADVV